MSAGSLALIAGLLLTACGGGHAQPVTEPTVPTLHLSPLADLAPAAGLSWLVVARTRAILAAPAVLGAVPESELDAFARATGGVDLRAAEEVVIAGYGGSTLALARQLVDPGRVEVAFTARVADVAGRAIDRGADPRHGLTRVWGHAGREKETLVLFDRAAVGIAVGSDAPLRAAELFASGRPLRSLPAWRAPPLDALGEALGDADLSVAAPGPFDGEWATAFEGLLATAVAIGLTARLEGDVVRVEGVVMGPWGDRAGDAGERVSRACDRLRASPLGHLVGLDGPAAAPRVRVSSGARGGEQGGAAGGAVSVEVRVPVAALVRGLRDATTASAGEMFTQIGRAPR